MEFRVTERYIDTQKDMTDLVVQGSETTLETADQPAGQVRTYLGTVRLPSILADRFPIGSMVILMSHDSIVKKRGSAVKTKPVADHSES